MNEKEIELRFGFIANDEFATKFYENAVVTEVAYLLPDNKSESTTTCRFRKRNGKATMTCKTSDGGASSVERFEVETSISNEAFKAFTEKLPVMRFYFYKDPETGIEFKSFVDKGSLPKMIAEKEFASKPTPVDSYNFAETLKELGNSIYDLTYNYAFNVSTEYKNYIKSF